MAGMYHGYAGNFRKAALYEEQAQRLSPIGLNDPWSTKRARGFISEIFSRCTRHCLPGLDREAALADRANNPRGGTLESRQRERGAHHRKGITSQPSQFHRQPLGTRASLSPTGGSRHIAQPIAKGWSSRMKGAIACRALPVRVEVDIKMLQTCWQPAGAVRQQPALGAWAASAAAAEAAEPSSTGRAGHIGMRKVRAKVGPPATMASRPAVAGTYPETHQPVFTYLLLRQ